MDRCKDKPAFTTKINAGLYLLCGLQNCRIFVNKGIVVKQTQAGYILQKAVIIKFYFSASFSCSGENSGIVCLFCIFLMQNKTIHARIGMATMQNKSAINRFPASPGPAVKAEMIKAIMRAAIAASAMRAASRFGFFFIKIVSLPKSDKIDYNNNLQEMQSFPLTFHKLWYILLLSAYKRADSTKMCDQDERM